MANGSSAWRTRPERWRPTHAARALVLAAALAFATPAKAQDALPVPGFGAASVVTPRDTSRPRPVVVALHGNFDRPEWMCAALAPVVRGRAFLPGPRGIARPGAPEGDARFTHRPLRGLLREVAAARAALVAAYPGRIDDGPDAWVGFSLGAHRAAAIAATDPARAPLLLLVEGGDALFEADAAERYAASAGRVGVVCGLPGCARRGARLVSALEAGSSAGRVERIETCHSCLDVLAPAMERVFDWLVSTDARFEP